MGRLCRGAGLRIIMKPLKERSFYLHNFGCKVNQEEGAALAALFLAAGWVSYAVLAAFLVAVIKISTIPPKSIIRGMKPLVMILVFTGILNIFFTTGEGEPLVDFWIFTVYAEGLERALFMIVRILMLISATFLLT